ncbi:MAG: glyoxalase [Phenylobacterium zucineum]|nr:MAG: glyoxalase [Phenylobacterium zucineum]
MKFGYTIIYTKDITKSIEFFEQAFGIQRRFIHESDYGELETGATTLAFAAHELGQSNMPDGYVRVDGVKPLGMEIALVSDDVAAAYAKAVATGAESIKAPVAKPWGQTVAYVRCPDGTLVELCSPMA